MRWEARALDEFHLIDEVLIHNNYEMAVRRHMYGMLRTFIKIY